MLLNLKVPLIIKNVPLRISKASISYFQHPALFWVWGNLCILFQDPKIPYENDKKPFSTRCSLPNLNCFVWANTENNAMNGKCWKSNPGKLLCCFKHQAWNCPGDFCFLFYFSTYFCNFFLIIWIFFWESSFSNFFWKFDTVLLKN